MARTNSSQDIIDSRDVIARIEELQDEREDLTGDDLTTWDEDNGPELSSLLALQDEAKGYSEWTDGAVLVRDSYFVDFARQEAEDLGLIPDNLSWPCTCIDWEQAAGELRMDYTSVEFDGVTYWVRA